MEFGEKIYFKEATYHQHANALEPKMLEGRYLGHHGRTGALLAITSEGVRRGKGLRRLPESERWTEVGWKELRGLPWEVEARERKAKVPIMDPNEAPQLIIPPVAVQGPVQRGFYVLAPDVKHFNPTEGCRGCESVVLHGKVLPGLSHTQACRERFERLLEGDEAGRRRLEKIRRGKRGAQANVGPGADDQEITAAEAAGEPERKRKAVGPAEDPRTLKL